MSGSSLDGVDLALCQFQYINKKWAYKIIETACIDYSEQWRKRLQDLPNSSAKKFCQTHFDYGHLLGEMTDNFLQKKQLKADLIASHGHTIFHSPKTNMTAQIGEGSAIAKATNCIVVNDLRTADIAHNGQGAPIVPLVDRLLFNKYKAWLNIGGIANISVEEKQKLTAFDICPANQVLNFLANKMNLKYDDKGEVAQSGNINVKLLNILNGLSYYKQSIPKSMANGWIRNEVLPLVEKSEASIEDKLRTVVEHIALQMKLALKDFKIETPILTTGGGAYNRFLVETIEAKTNLSLQIPSAEIIEYKEALAMAFLGLLRILKQENVLSSVTGADKNTINGAVYLP